MVSKSQISLLLVGCLLCRAFADSNPLAPVLNSVGNAVDSTLNDTNSAVDTTTGAHHWFLGRIVEGCCVL